MKKSLEQQLLLWKQQQRMAEEEERRQESGKDNWHELMGCNRKTLRRGKGGAYKQF